MLIVAAVVALFIVTCPNRADHTNAIMDVVNSSLNDKSKGEEDGWSILGSAIGSKIIGALLEQKLQVNNYFVCSVGQITLQGKTKTISVGVLNHVFTFKKEDLKGTLNETTE